MLNPDCVVSDGIFVPSEFCSVFWLGVPSELPEAPLLSRVPLEPPSSSVPSN